MVPLLLPDLQYWDIVCKHILFPNGKISKTFKSKIKMIILQVSLFFKDLMHSDFIRGRWLAKVLLPVGFSVDALMSSQLVSISIH